MYESDTYHLFINPLQAINKLVMELYMFSKSCSAKAPPSQLASKHTILR